MATGATSWTIAGERSPSPWSVERQLATRYVRLGVGSRAAALDNAWHGGVLSD